MKEQAGEGSGPMDTLAKLRKERRMAKKESADKAKEFKGVYQACKPPAKACSKTIRRWSLGRIRPPAGSKGEEKAIRIVRLNDIN